MAGAASLSVYSQAAYAAPSYVRTQLSAAPYLLSSRLYAPEEALSASQAQQAGARPPGEEEEKEEVEEPEQDQEAEDGEEEG